MLYKTLVTKIKSNHLEHQKEDTKRKGYKIYKYRFVIAILYALDILSLVL